MSGVIQTIRKRPKLDCGDVIPELPLELLKMMITIFALESEDSIKIISTLLCTCKMFDTMIGEYVARGLEHRLPETALPFERSCREIRNRLRYEPPDYFDPGHANVELCFDLQFDAKRLSHEKTLFEINVTSSRYYTEHCDNDGPGYRRSTHLERILVHLTPGLKDFMLSKEDESDKSDESDEWHEREEGKEVVSIHKIMNQLRILKEK